MSSPKPFDELTTQTPALKLRSIKHRKTASAMISRGENLLKSAGGDTG